MLLTLEHYYYIAWDGLRYIDSKMAEDKYGENSKYYKLYQELIQHDPLQLNCN